MNTQIALHLSVAEMPLIIGLDSIENNSFEAISENQARYWRSQAKKLAGRVNVIDPARRSLASLREIFPAGTIVYRARWTVGEILTNRYPLKNFPLRRAENSAMISARQKTARLNFYSHLALHEISCFPISALRHCQNSSLPPWQA